MSHPTNSSPYVPGEQISLHLNDGSRIEASIVKVLTCTLSCVIFVQLQHDGMPKNCVVKLYDRRFATQLRSDENASMWNTSLEAEYQNSVISGKVQPMFTYWTKQFTQDIYWEDPISDEWDATQREAYLQFQSWTAYSTETHAYDLLQNLQGRHVPKLLGKSTSMLAFPLDLKSPVVNENLVGCPGIILSFIEGFSLSDIKISIGREYWQGICEKAIEVVALIGQRGMLNRDVRPRSFIVQQDEQKAFNISMIDFGLCRFRDQARNDAEFEEWQAGQDEEGAVGYLMQHQLEGGFVYRRSARAQLLSKKYKSES